MSAVLRAALVTITAFLLRNWWKALLAIAIIAIVILSVGPIIDGAIWTRNAFVNKWQEWQVAWNAPWPTPAPVVSLPVAAKYSCEFDVPFEGKYFHVVGAPSDKPQKYQLDNGYWFVFVCKEAGRVKYSVTVLPPEYVGMPDVTPIPYEPDAVQPLTQLNRNNQPPPAAVTAVPLICDIVSGVQTTEIDGGCLWASPDVRNLDVPAGWYAHYGQPVRDVNGPAIIQGINRASLYRIP